MMETNLTAKLLGCAFLLLSATLPAEAVYLTPEQSLSRAETFSSVRRLPGNARFALAHTEKAVGESFLYVFNKGENGFIVTSADDRMPALLGYSDNGAFNLSDVSPEFQWWLSQYAAQAEAALKSDKVKISVANAVKTAKSNIGEMLTTRWDQDSPYNLDCPSDKNGQCVTGCVATAMAQVIKYHGYPVNGKGRASYTWQGKTLSYDYSNANFDYHNMLDEYPRNADTSTRGQKDAVANLMYACGVGVKMQYTSRESGASDIHIPYALKEYFDYDKDIQYLQRDYFTAEDWADIVYAELEAGRPVIYGGQSNNGGHEFVCDGYEDGYFHINWGWSGYCNGWFLLSALNPEGQGIGGGDGGFNYYQSIICGVQPNAGNPGISYPLYASGGLEAGRVGNFYGKQAVTVGISNGGIWNYSPEVINTSFYLKAVSASGDEYFSSNGYDVSFQAADDRGMSGYTSFYCYIPAVPEGEYKAYVMYMGPQGKRMPLWIPLTGATYLNMTVDAEGNVSFTNADPEEKASIVVTEFSPLSSVVSGEETSFKISLRNTGNVTYSGLVSLQTYNKGTEDCLQSIGIEISVVAGQSLSGTIDYTYDLPDGEYEVRFFDMYEEPCSDAFTLVIGNQEIAPSSISLDIVEKTLSEGESFMLTATVAPENAIDKTVTWTSSDVSVATVAGGVVSAIASGTAIINATTSNGLTASCAVTVEKKFIYASSISLDKTSIEAEVGETVTLEATVLPDDATDKTVAWSSSDESVATVDQDGKVSIISTGIATIIAATTDGSDLKAECVINGVSYVEAIVIEAGKVDIYTLDGILIRKNADVSYVSTLAKGTYIIRTSSQTIKIVK